MNAGVRMKQKDGTYLNNSCKEVNMSVLIFERQLPSPCIWCSSPAWWIRPRRTCLLLRREHGGQQQAVLPEQHQFLQFFHLFAFCSGVMNTNTIFFSPSTSKTIILLSSIPFSEFIWHDNENINLLFQIISVHAIGVVGEPTGYQATNKHTLPRFNYVTGPARNE